MTTHEGVLENGSRYLVEVPEAWNEVLLLCSRPVPAPVGSPSWEPDDPLFSGLVRHGYAVAGSANSIFWPLEQAFSDQPALLDIAAGVLGPARHTVGLGVSIGGIIAAGALQRYPDRFSGALPLCGNLAGAVGTHNRELDIAFSVRTLLAPGSALQLTGITDQYANLTLALEVLRQAQATPAGRARLGLAAAIGNIPGWHDPTSPEPPAGDVEARQRNQHAWFEEIGFLVYFLARKEVEEQAGGNPSWNTDVDYGGLLAASINRDEVEALYGAAGLDLDRDLQALADEGRIQADPDAVSYLERHIVFDGDLAGVPVLTLHTSGDGLVTPDHERAYADVVGAAGQAHLLRQLFIRRAGHCSFTVAEVLAGLDVLLERIERGVWPSVDPVALNRAAAALGPDEPVEAAYFSFEPPTFPRPHDQRDTRPR